MKKLLILDLDDTIIVSDNMGNWRFKSGILKNIYKYNKSGYSIVIVTNQGGINKGYDKPSFVSHKVNEVVREITQYINFDHNNKMINTNTAHNYDNNVLSYHIGLHDGHDIRKPNAKWFLELYDQNEYDYSESIMVGDAMGLKIELPKKEIKYVYPIDDGRHENLNPFGKPINYTRNVDGKLILTIGEDYGEDYVHEINDSDDTIETSNSVYRCIVTGDHVKLIKTHKKDFSDSDLLFARNLGVGECYHADDFCEDNDIFINLVG